MFKNKKEIKWLKKQIKENEAEIHNLKIRIALMTPWLKKEFYDNEVK